MQPMPRLVLPALTLAAMLAGPAMAQTAPTAALAASLEKQVRDALVSATDGAVPVPPRPVEFTAEGDHYLVRVPLGAFGKVEPADAAFTAQARMLDATRWSIDNQQFPPDLKFITTITVPDSPDAKNPSPDGKHKETATYAIKLGQQDAHSVFDPTYMTPTTSAGTISGVDILRAGGSAAGITHIDHVSTQTTMHPAGPARIDLLSDMTADRYATESSLPDGTTFKLTAQTLHVVGGINGLAHEKLLPLLHAAIATGQLKPNPDEAKGKAEVAAALRKMLAMAHGLLTGGLIDESATDVKFDFGGHVGTMSKVRITLACDAPQDMLTASMSFSLDGLTSDDLPPAMAAYLPTRVAIQPSVSNLSVSDLTRIMNDASMRPDGSAPSAEVQALFQHGGINVGFDSLALDIAGTQITGAGKFNFTGPQTVTGQSEITAHGLDALIAKAQADPMLAQGVPVAIFLKGIARVNGDQAVWQIAVNNKKVLVNGVDLSAIAGGMK